MKKTYTKAVSATLASALAVGMVPAMAFAVEGDDVEMDLQAIDHEANAKAGSVIAYNTAVQAPMQSGNVFVAGTGATNTVTGVTTYTALAPLTVKGKYSDDAYPVTDILYAKLCEDTADDAKNSAEDFTAGSFTVDDKAFSYTGSAVSVTSLTVGSWAVLVKVDTNDDGVGDTWVTECETFSIVAGNISDFEIYEIGADLDDLSDETFVYNGGAWGFGSNAATGNQLNIKNGDEALALGTDYTVALYDENKALISGGADAVVTDEGTYTAKITGIGDYQGVRDIELVIAPLNLNNAAVSFDTPLIKAGTAAPAGVLVNNESLFSTDDLVIQYDETGTAVAKTYWATVKDAKANDGNVVGEKRVSFDAVKQIIIPTLTYDNGTSLDIDRTASKPASFDVSKLKLVYGATEFSYADGEFSLVVMKWSDDAQDYVIPAQLSDLTDASVWGDFQVTAKINPANLDEAYKYGGNSTAITVDIDNGEIDDASVAFTYGGKLVTDIPTGTIAFDGSNKLSSIGITVTVDGKTVTSGYTVEVKKQKGADWVKVDSIVDAGTYNIVVKSDKYEVTDITGLTVVVDPAVVEVVWADQKANVTGSQLFYTGKALNPVAGFTTEVNGVDVAIDVPASAYAVTISEYSKKNGAAWAAVTPKPATITEVGYYKIALADILSDNYTVTAVPEKTIAVTEDAYFVDVPSDAWYAEVVYTAYQTGIVNGIEGTKLFAPGKDVKRGDFVCMLYNLAGVKSATGSTGSADKGYVSFSDVDEDAYYAEAVAWAKQAGVANGHNGLFRPSDTMTREEGIAFIANYADACGVDVEVAAADIAAELAKYPDGAKVSGWAEEVVAWACIADVAGNGKTINPKGTMTRAEAAAMLVNFAGEYAPARLEQFRK